MDSLPILFSGVELSSTTSTTENQTNRRSASAFNAPPRFLNPTADLIVTSSDNVEFKTWKAILIEGSFFFKGMLEDSMLNECTIGWGKVERVRWDETAKIINHLLILMYPIPKPAINSLDEIFDVIRAAEKWQIPVAIDWLKATLLCKKFVDVDRNAFKIYAFACEMDFTDIRDEVAKKASEIDPFGIPVRSHTRHMTALDLLRLVKLRSAPYATFDSHFTLSPNPDATATMSTGLPDSSSIPSEFRDTNGDLAVHSADGVEFSVFRLFLACSSPKLRDRILKLSETSSAHNQGTRPALSLPLPASIILTLLYYIYPLPRSPTKTGTSRLEHLILCMRAAIEWDIQVAVSAFREELMSPLHLQTRPLKIYGFANSMGFEEEKKIARTRAILFDPMENRNRNDFTEMTGYDLIQLREFRTTLVKRLMAALRKLSFPSSPSSCVHFEHYSHDDASHKATLDSVFVQAMCQAIIPNSLVTTPDLYEMLVGGTCLECRKNTARFRSSEEIIEQVNKVLKEHLVLYC
ncbi:hypothetical protein DACRYDRAFT_15463 [Dacryopinax primogenitus]|uniref:BTB domain-containing protein n=1 Tax=Dacryopinax primogenitus (strain DJM 731) TaxID=1858805 RepID=M5FXV2_DACPD|nr:uncharacterized protein DACRYDRAFT_15463 [Dacryopinax primogenitus]EJU02871.1 hypothetical protein DACRYDRAFT_15463 [Dacryopinax primogenitus]